MHNSLFVFDIETVPDTTALKNLLGADVVDGMDEPELRDALEQYHLEITKGNNSFPRQPFHKIVAISFLEAEIIRNGAQEEYILKEIRSGGTLESSEEELVKGVYSYLSKRKPRFVSYNGRNFDFPVMKFRAMKYGVQADWFYQTGDKWNNYNSRYSADWHCDLLDVLKDFGAMGGGLKLNEVCSILGLPGKFGPDGSQVTDMIDSDNLAGVRDYCETDVLNTYLVYLRTQHHKGILSDDALNRAITDCLDYVDNHTAERPHLAEFKQAWQDACNGEFLPV